jgi:hypothetical protein
VFVASLELTLDCFLIFGADFDRPLSDSVGCCIPFVFALSLNLDGEDDRSLSDSSSSACFDVCTFGALFLWVLSLTILE